MKKIILFLALILSAVCSSFAQQIDYLENQENGTIIKMSPQGDRVPNIYLYENYDAYANPTKFTKKIRKFYPDRKQLIESLEVPFELNGSITMQDLILKRTYGGLLLWITANPDKDPDFGKIEDWVIVYKE